MFGTLRKWFRGTRQGRATEAGRVQTFRPALEALEDRRLLSANLFSTARLLPLNLPAVPSPIVGSHALINYPGPGGLVQAAPQVITPLRGQGGGTYSEPFKNPDGPHEFDLQGTVSLQGLGVMTVQGSLFTGGTIQIGPPGAAGTLTLTNRHGSLTLRLTSGPLQKGFFGLPADFQYVVISGTGSFAHAADRGALHLSVHPAVAGGSQGIIEQGSFGLTIASDHHVLHIPPHLPSPHWQ
jgi:hypothetical protein